MEDGESLIICSGCNINLYMLYILQCKIKTDSKSLENTKNNYVYNKFTLDVIFESYKKIFNT